MNRSLIEISNEIKNLAHALPFDSRLQAASDAGYDDNRLEDRANAAISYLPRSFIEMLASYVGNFTSTSLLSSYHIANLVKMSVPLSKLEAGLAVQCPDLDTVPEQLTQMNPISEGAWPAQGSLEENILLEASVVIYFDRDQGQTLARMSQILQTAAFEELTRLILSLRSIVFALRAGRKLSDYSSSQLTETWERLLEDNPELNQLHKHIFTAHKDCDTAVQSNRATVAADALRFSQIIEQAPFPISLCSAEDFRYSLANRMYREAIGRHDIIGKTVPEAFPDEPLDTLLINLIKTREGIEPEIPREHSVELRNADGNSSNELSSRCIKLFGMGADE